jgi:hypothetical protein
MNVAHRITAVFRDGFVESTVLFFFNLIPVTKPDWLVFVDLFPFPDLFFDDFGVFVVILFTSFKLIIGEWDLSADVLFDE